MNVLTVFFSKIYFVVTVLCNICISEKYCYKKCGYIWSDYLYVYIIYYIPILNLHALGKSSHITRHRNLYCIAVRARSTGLGQHAVLASSLNSAVHYRIPTLLAIPDTLAWAPHRIALSDVSNPRRVLCDLRVPVSNAEPTWSHSELATRTLEKQAAAAASRILKPVVVAFHRNKTKGSRQLVLARWNRSLGVLFMLPTLPSTTVRIRSTISSCLKRKIKNASRCIVVLSIYPGRIRADETSVWRFMAVVFARDARTHAASWDDGS